MPVYKYFFSCKLVCMKNKNIFIKQSFISWRTHMKSFSFKALVLALVVVAGSAQAGFTETVKEYEKQLKESCNR